MKIFIGFTGTQELVAFLLFIFVKTFKDHKLWLYPKYPVKTLTSKKEILYGKMLTKLKRA